MTYSTLRSLLILLLKQDLDTPAAEQKLDMCMLNQEPYTLALGQELATLPFKREPITFALKQEPNTLSLESESVPSVLKQEPYAPALWQEPAALVLKQESHMLVLGKDPPTLALKQGLEKILLEYEQAVCKFENHWIQPEYLPFEPDMTMEDLHAIKEHNEREQRAALVRRAVVSDRRALRQRRLSLYFGTWSWVCVGRE